MASSRPCHQVSGTNTSRRYEPAKAATRIAVFTYICQQSRCRRSVVRKYASTRRRSSSWKALSLPNLTLRPGATARTNWPEGLVRTSCCVVIAVFLDSAEDRDRRYSPVPNHRREWAKHMPREEGQN